MTEYVIDYHAINHYEQPFYEAFLEFLIFPQPSSDQQVIHLTHESEPWCSTYFSSNVNGFRVLRCRLPAQSETFELRMKARVAKSPINPFEYQPLEIAGERAMLRSHEFQVEHFAFLQQTHFTLLPEGRTFPSWKPDEPVFDFCQRVTAFVFNCLDYDARHASVHNTVLDVLNDHKGVCQDFAHLMLGILRLNMIPCRYVTGYLHPGPGHKGSAAIHAWTEVYVPGNGWTGFDPTNNLMEDVHYIKIAHGVDLDECQTLRGVVRSAGRNSTEYEVHVRESEMQNLPQ